jgi:TPR repeat protein
MNGMPAAKDALTKKLTPEQIAQGEARAKELAKESSLQSSDPVMGFSDYKVMFQATMKKAEQGNAEAQYNLGLNYFHGHGVSRDHEEAVKWYRKAAEQGHARAQDNLGSCYAKGEGVLRDHKEAAKWFRTAAEQGDADAQNNLGGCYAEGKGVPQDFEEAVKWYRKAAEQGHARAQYNLG